MTSKNRSLHSLEVLEARIAPASLITQARVVPAIVDTPILLHAGDLLNTGTSLQGGTYLLYIEKGDALIFTTDMNNNGVVDFNEITGISAGNGLRMVSFVDIHGDIVTNLNPNFTLTDSDNNSSNDNPFLKGDGRVLRNATVEKLELRSITTEDVVDSNGDGVVDESDVAQHLAMSSYSLFGSVYAGAGFGVSGDDTSGLVIDDSGRNLQSVVFGTTLGFDYFIDFKPSIGSIKVGTATNGNYYSFGISRGDDSQGYLATFIPPAGQAGGGVFNIRGATPTTDFNIDAAMAGDGGRGAKGGNVENVALISDTAGGYVIQAGNGGIGPNGGEGGSIVNFSDSGSYTSQIVIRSGDGGSATTGVGGNGGTASFGEMNVNGGLGVTLGSGGDGFTAGGTGASIGKGVFTTPTGSDSAANMVRGSVHVPGQIGSAGILDFDHDGVGDVVYTSFNPNQLVVQFGDPMFGFRAELTPDGFLGEPKGIQLFGVSSADALAVGDLNGDGFDDIVTGSHEEGDFGGIVVFLSKTEDTNHDGILGQGEDLNRNGVIDFVGFEAPVRSPLPSLYAGDAVPDTFGYIYRRSATPISEIVIGDFNGDGNAELAVAATYISQSITQQKVQVLLFMSPDLEEVSPGIVQPTGQFFADVGTKATSQPPAPANVLHPFTRLNGPNEGDQTDSIVVATAMSTGALNDVVVARAFATGSNVFVVDYSAPSAIGPTVAASGLPQVDTSRGNGVNLQDVSPRDFIVSDTNNDGNADLTVISASPNNYLVAKLGDGVGFPTALIGGGGDDTGALLDDFIDPDTDSVLIRNTTTTGTEFDEVVILFAGGNTGSIQFSLADAPGNMNGNGQLTTVGTVNIGGSGLDIIFLNGVDQPVNSVAVEGLGVLLPRYVLVDTDLLGVFPYYLAAHTVNIAAGDGGSALVGRGGNAGNIGSDLQRVDTVDPVTGAVTTDLVGSISIGLSSAPADAGEVNIISGTGGNGFTTGGKGGSIQGTTTRYNGGGFVSISTITAGDGGLGVAGKGGAGGDLVANSFESGTFVNAGNGGFGSIGGDGGSVTGNGRSGSYDNRTLFQRVNAGLGGGGIKAGGNGGSIIDFHGAFDLQVQGSTDGLLSYAAGAGGASVSGTGGNGGSVINVSPVVGENFLAGNITLIGGDGGNGRKGGQGGDVQDFVNNPSQSDNPAVLTFIAGNGGAGTLGKGGHGGDVMNITTPSTGKPNLVAIFDPNNPFFTFNRFLGGDGGSSPGGKGGNGGSVANILTSNSDNPFVMVAGAGGDGLYKGGSGGDLHDLQVNLGAGSFNKALFIGGAGGSAAAFIPNPLDSTPGQENKAFGGRVGKAGNGGNIANVTQFGSIGARIDLIAGNGGDTINYGSIIDKKIYVGKGGSIMNVHLDGNIGNIDPTVSFSSYNDVLNGESVQDFVTQNLRLMPGPIDDSVGMVGAVVGAAGRLKEVPAGGGEFRSQPAPGGKNGKLIDISARNIASAVAGSVDRIATIQVVSGIRITAGNDIGKDFDNTIDPAPFRNQNGDAVATPVLDGMLVDGALIYKKFKPDSEFDELPPGNTFRLA